MAVGAIDQGLFPELHADLAAVEAFLAESLAAEPESVQEVTTHLLRAGGKRLRPALVLMGGKFGDYQLEKLLPVAAAVEMIHMATLVHDDIIDRAPLRRGFPTVNAKWSDHTAVLTGDYLFAKAFSLLGETGNNRIVRLMADVVFGMCTGEIEQNQSRGSVQETEARYMERIGKKTALFIAESLRAGGIMAGVGEEGEGALFRYGYNLGLGFQIIDDVLDLTAEAEVFGKAIGSDLRSGVITLPVIHALSHSPKRARLLEITALDSVGAAEVREVVEILRPAGSLGYAMDRAAKLIQEAKEDLRFLPDRPMRRTLLDLGEFILERRV